MFESERRQIRYDFGLAPELVGNYLPDEAYQDGVALVRQVNGVTTYLSQMATGEVRHYEAVVYAAAIAGVDCVTDIRNEEVGEPVRAALGGDVEYPELELVPQASEAARGDGFETALIEVAESQDVSLTQFDDIRPGELWDITRFKGGWSAKAHLEAIKSDVTAEEDELMEEFGFLMQLLDDYLDQPEDKREGISTLFTEGEMNSADLAEKIDEVERRTENVWGRSEASERFFDICRYHRRIGQLANHTPLDPEQHIPYYF